MIRNVIFDWSGTLVDDLPAVLAASNAVFRQAGVPEMSLDQFRAQFCLPFQKFYERYVGHVPIAQLEEWFHAAFEEVQSLVIELPHAREFLLFCREKGLRTFLLSSVHRKHFGRQAANTNFGAFLEQAYVEVWDKRVKIRELLREHALQPEETLFVGDMQHDIETAHHGGVFACAVLTGYNSLDQLRTSKPDLIVEHLGELRTILEASGFQIASDPTGHSGRAGAPGVAQLPVPTVGALVYDQNNQVLMIRTQKWSGLWGIPGGKIKYGESSEEALRREILEETGLQIAEIEFVLVQDCIRSPEFYREAHFILLNYTCTSTTDTPVQLNSEAQEFQWLSPEAARNLPLNAPTRRLLEAVQNKAK